MPHAYNWKGFKPEDHKGRELVPPGEYKAMIVNLQWKDTQAGTGRYLNIEFEVSQGKYKGRKVWAALNLINPSTQAVAFANDDLADICRAAGVAKPENEHELQNKFVVLKLGIKEATDRFKAKNVIVSYRAPKYEQGTNPPAAPEPTPGQAEVDDCPF